MSSFTEDDKLDLITRLQSNKIKDRNEALVKLEQFASQPSHLINKFSVAFLSSVIDTIFKAIAIETASYTKSKAQLNHSTEERLLKASQLLKNILVKIKDDKFRRKFKFKYYLSILKAIVSASFSTNERNQDQLIDPVLLDLLKIFHMLLELREFKLHFSASDNLFILSFLLKGSQSLISRKKTGDAIDEKVLIEFLQSLNTLCFDNENSPPNFLNGKTSVDHYANMIQLVRNYQQEIFLSNKKESLSLILIFRLINQMLIRLSVNNIGYCHKLFRIGFQLFNGLKFITFDSLKEQLMIFINIAPLFIDLGDVPKQEGDNWNFDSEFSIEQETRRLGVDRSFLRVAESIPLTGEPRLLEPSEERKYNNELTAFISQLFELLLSPSHDFKLLTDNIHLKIIPESSKENLNWFNFRYMNLKKGGDSPKAWLLRTGLTNILDVYFRLKHRSSAEFRSSTSTTDNNSSMTGYSRSTKRRKLNTLGNASIGELLESSVSVTDFLILAANNLTTDNAPSSSLQLLCFLLGGPIFSLESEGFSFQSIAADVLKMFEFQDNNLNYWSLFCLKLLLLKQQETLNGTAGDELTNLQINQALRYSLDMIKIASLTEVSCSLVCTILEINEEKDLKWRIEKQVIKQLEALIQLSEINGPSIISGQTIYFWFRIFDYSKTLKIAKGDFAHSSGSVINGKIQDWLFSKWNQLADWQNFADLSILSIFISWLSGSQDLIINEASVKEKSYIYDGHLMIPCTQWLTYSDLRSFCLVNQNLGGFSVLDFQDYQLENLQVSPAKLDLLLTKVRKFGEDLQMFHDNDIRHKEFICHWFFALLRICDALQPQLALEAYYKSLTYQATRLLEDELDEKNFKEDGTELFTFFKLVVELDDNKSTVMKNVLARLPTGKMVESALSLWNKTSRKENEFFDEKASFKGFGDIKRAKVHDIVSNSNEVGTGFYDLSCQNYPELFLIGFIICSGKYEGARPEELLDRCYSLISKMSSSNRVLRSLFSLTNSDITLDTCSKGSVMSHLEKVIKLYAERLLANFDFERSELTVILGCQILSKYRAYWCVLGDVSLKQDCTDIALFLFKLVESCLVDTEQATSSYLCLLLTLLTQKDYPFEQTEVLSKVIAVALQARSNFVMVSFVEEVVLFLRSQSHNRQARIYNSLQELFPTPQQSVESAATYCYFVGVISKSSFSILASGVFNLIELASFQHFQPYIRYALADFSEFFAVKDIRVLFRAFRLDIFKYWVSYGMEISDFPFRLFDYKTYHDFLGDNYKDIIALEFINKSKPREPAIQAILKIRNCREIDVLFDSLSLIISLAYSEKAIRNEIFSLLRNALKSESFLVEQLKSQDLLIILEILRLCDVSDVQKLNEFVKMLSGSNDSTMLFNNSASIAYPRAHVSISCHTAYNAIESILNDIYPESSGFWSLPNTYFLVRRLLILVDDAISISDKVAHLKRIKLLLSFPFADLRAPKLLVLIVRELSKHMSEMEPAEEICSILLLLWTGSSDIVKEELYVPSFITVLSKIVNIKGGSESSVSRLVSWMRNFIERLKSSEPHLSILLASLDISQGLTPKITVRDIERALELADYQYDYNKGNSLFTLICSFFSDCPVLNESVKFGYSNNPIVAERLLKQDVSPEVDFMLWRARYLGMFFSETGVIPETKKTVEDDRYLKEYENNFEENVGTLDNVFLEMVRFDNPDNQIASYIEYILGVILWRNENRDEDKIMLRYNKNFHKYERTIMKMDFHTCILLMHESEDEKKIFHLKHLSEVVSNIHSLIINNKSDIWTSILALSLTNELSSVTGLAQLISTVILKIPSFSKRLFNHIVMFYIHSVKGGGAQINALLSRFFDLERLAICLDCKKMFIDLILLLRIGAKQNRREFVTAYKGINFPAVYRDAISVGLPQTSLMIMESYFTDPPEGMRLKWQNERRYLSEVYESLDDSFDLVYGLPVEPTLEYGINLINKGSENSFRSILFNSGLLDTSLATGKKASDSNEMVSSALSVGLHGLSKVIAESHDSNEVNEENSDHAFEWAWKLNQWDIPVSRHKKNSATENSIVYKTLKLMHDYPNSCHDICKESLQEVIYNKRKFLAPKDEKDLAVKDERFFRSLATLCNIESILKCDNESLETLLTQDLLISAWYQKSDFEKFENILLGRKAAFEFLANVPERISKLPVEEAWSSVLFELTKYGDFARKNGESQKSINSSIYFNSLVKSKFSDSNNEIKEFASKCAQFQIACTFWDQGETGFPVATLKEIIKRERVYQMTKTKTDDEIVQQLPYRQMQLSSPFIASMIVKWSSESRQESSSSIMDKYLEVVSTEMVESRTQQAEIYHNFATFCDQYLKDQSLNEEIGNYSSLIDKKEKELLQLKEFKDDRRNSKEDRDAAKSKYARIYRMRAHDKEELNRIIQNRNRFVLNATKFYLKCIAISDSYDVDVDRFCGIWLEYSSSEELNSIVNESLSLISNHKFIAWVSQLMSRLADELNSFQYSLAKLLEGLSYRHPYHTVYLIKSLRLHLNILNNDPGVESRALAADKLWRRLALKSAKFTEDVLVPVDNLCESSCDLANERFERASKVKLLGLKIGQFWLKTLPSYSLPPPTLEIPVDKNGNYRTAPFIIKTDHNLSVATSGVSLPKIMTFQLSNGDRHKMLLKGGSDDLRQDAIMEQVFEKVNKIFQNYRETRIRELRIRTYKVVPLGPQAGLIEFVRNSVPLNDILKPLHEKQDKLKLDGARSLMKRVQKAGLNDRIKAYYAIMEKVKPVMRIFFYDNFLDPQDWFKSKITYTRGISTTSFVGYLLGLGDRHSNNILLDNSTGEPIHIDLGVAFDQGKRLPIPETVPFRLTRDVVDGFGVTGVEGCFIKSSEHVMRVLRLETERIMDILNILKYDPLYSWTLSPIRRQKLQEQGEMLPSEDIEATDAIEGVRKKLNSSDLSVEAMVRELTQEAMDPDKLACIYMGWSPFY